VTALADGFRLRTKDYCGLETTPAGLSDPGHIRQLRATGHSLSLCVLSLPEGRNRHQWIFPQPQLTMECMNPEKKQQFLSGADWVRVDFHLHTRADREFQYAGDDSFYNSAYIDALEQSGIRLGVITNQANGQWCTGRGSRNPGRGICRWT
jgi:hypothetical protein